MFNHEDTRMVEFLLRKCAGKHKNGICVFVLRLKTHDTLLVVRESA